MRNVVGLCVLMVLLASCGRKKYMCRCTTTVHYSGSGQDQFFSKSVAIDEKMNEKQAKAVCDNEAVNIEATYRNFLTNNGNWSANGTTMQSTCSVD